MLAALDLVAGKIYYRIRERKRRTHTEQNTAIEGYVRWRNARATPKTTFATDSPIRTWTHCPTKVA